MKIALTHQTQPTHVLLDNAHVARMINVHLQRFVLMENASVSICQLVKNFNDQLYFDIWHTWNNWTLWFTPIGAPKGYTEKVGLYCKNNVGSDKTLNDSIVACNLDSQCPGVFSNCGVDFRICQSPIEEAELPCGPILYVKGANLAYVQRKYNILKITPICSRKI